MLFYSCQPSFLLFYSHCSYAHCSGLRCSTSLRRCARSTSARSATARVSGVGPVASMVVVLVAFLLMSVGEPLLGQQLAPLLPDAEATREAFEAGMQ